MRVRRPSFDWVILGALASAAALWAAGCQCAQDPGFGSCETDADCSGGQVCEDGTCRAAPDGSVARDAGGGASDAGERDGGPPGCTRRTCEEEGANCGPVADGCGGFIECGTCPEGQACGAGGVPSVCGAGLESCVTTSCTAAGANCGFVSDGCGGLLDCGACTVPGERCGFSGPNVCGAPMGDPEMCPAVLTCMDQGIECGMAGNGCGGMIDCGGCATGWCGGGGTPGRCGEPPCTPRTCADYPGVNCGPVADGCGGITASCGTCVAPDICGGGGTPSVCGGGFRSDPGCTGLCLHQAFCAGGGATTLTGTVYAPNGTLPLPNVMVYVPNAALPAITSGISCDRCEDEDLGSPLVGTISGVDGTFTLRHVPAGIAFPLVIKIGKWRRVVTIPAQTACGTTALGAALTRLPRNQSEGDIPRMAISTGSVDAIECVVRKLGVDDAEFTRPSATGRIHLYRANGAWADNALRTSCNSSCTDRATGTCNATCRAQLSDNLYGNEAVLNSYDLAIFDCEASAARGSTRSTAHQTRMRNYVNSGGRLFLSHFSYDWIDQNAPLSTTATWGGSGSSGSATAFVDDSFPRGVIFRDWLSLNGALLAAPPPRVTIQDPRGYVTANNASLSRRWLNTVNGMGASYNSIQTYTFNTPVGAADDAICGRVVYNGFHVVAGTSTSSQNFPSHCSTGALTAQEKVLAFMLFDLSTCLSGDDPPPPPSCTARTCMDLGADCGLAGDGCGGTLDCGPCPPGSTCGGGGIPNMCGGGCMPQSCTDLGAECGLAGDGCGSLVDCGPCPPGMTCGGDGIAFRCGTGPDCVPRTCEAAGAECGLIGDGCGGSRNCGSCPPPLLCGGGGVPYRCGGCRPRTCAELSAECGQIADGCGNLVECGECPPGLLCGVEEANRCGSFG